MSDELLAEFGFGPRQKTSKIPTWDEFIGSEKENPRTPEEYNAAREFYKSKYAEEFAKQRAGKEPSRNKTEWRDRVQAEQESFAAAVDQYAPTRKADTAGDKILNAGRSFLASFTSEGAALANTFSTERGLGFGEFLQGATESLNKGITPTRKLLDQRNAQEIKDAEARGMTEGLWANVTGAITPTSAAGLAGSVATSVLGGGAARYVGGKLVQGGAKALGAGSSGTGAATAAGGTAGAATYGAATGVGYQRNARYEAAEREAKRLGYSDEAAQEAGKRASILPADELLAAIASGTLGQLTGIEGKAARSGISAGTSRFATAKTIGKATGAEIGTEAIDSGREKLGANRALIELGFQEPGTEMEGVPGAMVQGGTLGALGGAAGGGYKAATDKTQYVGDIAKTIDETKALAPARIKQIGKIVEKYAGGEGLDKLASMDGVGGDTGLAAKIAAKMTGRVAPEPEAKTPYTPTQEEQDLINRSNALEANDGESQTVETVADGQPVAQFGTYIPSETGSQPNTEAPTRLAKMLDEETGNGPITIEAATSLAKEHEQGYSQWAAQDTTPGAVKREPQGFIEGTVDNILATAYLQGMELDPEAEARGKARAEKFMAEREKIEGSDRYEIGDRTKPDGQLATETEFQANSPQDNLVPVRPEDGIAAMDSLVGQVVEYGDRTGTMTKTDTGYFVGGELVDSGLSGQTPQQLGVKPVAGPRAAALKAGEDKTAQAKAAPGTPQAPATDLDQQAADLVAEMEDLFGVDMANTMIDAALKQLGGGKNFEQQIEGIKNEFNRQLETATAPGSKQTGQPDTAGGAGQGQAVAGKDEQTTGRQPAQEAAKPEAGVTQAAEPAPATKPVAEPETKTASDKPSARKNNVGALRAAAYKKNPLLTLLADKGLFHDKDKGNSLKSEFSPDRQIMVSGYGPIFKKSGKRLDDLLVNAIEDGYLPQDATEQDLYSLIQRAIGGEKIAPTLSEQGMADMEAEFAAKMDEQNAGFAEREPELTDAQWYGMDEDVYADMMATEVSQVQDEALSKAVDDLMDAPAGNMDTRAAMEALGFTEQEILDELKNENRGSPEKADETPTREAGRGNEAGAAKPEKVTTGLPKRMNDALQNLKAEIDSAPESATSPRTPEAKPAESETPAAEPAETSKLTQAQAADLMAWQSMGTKDGVTKHILTFHESQADKDAKRGRMIMATVTKGDRSATAWMVDGDDQTFGPLSLAKKRGMEMGMDRAVADGFVEKAERPAQAASPAEPPKKLPTAPAVRKQMEKKAAEAEAKEQEAEAPSRELSAVLAKNLSTIIPQQQKYERVFGRSQWPGYLKRLISGNDVLKQFMLTPAVGDTAFAKIALAKAKESADLVRIADKLEKVAAKAKTEAQPVKTPTAPAVQKQMAKREAEAEQAQSVVAKPGLGFNKGKFQAEVDGDLVPGGPWATEADAIKAGEDWKQKTIDQAKDAENEAAKWDALAERLRAGEEPTSAELKMIGLKDGMSDIRWFFPITAKLFGTSSRAIRPIVKDIIRFGTSDMGARNEYIPSKEGLKAVAKSLAPEAEPLTTPTKAEIEAKQDQEANAPQAQQREQIRKESEIGDSTFMTGFDGDARQDTTGNLFEAKQEGKKAPEKIEDLGEKIGGARKDNAPTAKRKAMPKAKDDRPAWSRRYEVSQIALGPNEGKWVIRDSRTKDWMGKPKQVGGSGNTFATEQEALDAIPLAAVSQKHRAVPTGTKGADGEYNYEIWRDINDRKRVKVVDQVFPSRVAALEYMANNAQAILETNTTFGEADLPRPDTINRTGEQRRTGDVDGKDFMESFGLRGVEFGNWNNQVERQELMNAAYDGLMDLANVLQIPPKAIGLNGDLALAFGARGQGLSSARAHYEPARAVINLTKMSGAGALAHEWLHAMDHYFARQDGKAASEWKIEADGTRTLSIRNTDDYMVSSGFKRVNSGVRQELRDAYTKVMETMFAKAEQYVEDTAKADQFVAKSREDVAKRLDMLRKDLSEQKDVRYYKRNNKPASAEQLAEFDTVAKQIMDGESLEVSLVKVEGSRTATGNRWSNEALEQLSAIYKAVRGRSGFGTGDNRGVMDDLRGDMTRYSQRLKMLADAQAGSEKTKKVPTEFAMSAKELDQGRGENYWTTPHEMAARAFQGYVEDKIAEQGAQSPFLNYAPENAGILTPWGAKRPYPYGSERKAINKAFDEFVSVLQTKETDKGVMLFSKANTEPTGNTVSAINQSLKDEGLDKNNIKVVQSLSEADAKGLEDGRLSEVVVDTEPRSPSPIFAVKPPKKLYRGEASVADREKRVAGAAWATLGRGLYTTTDRSFAKQFGNVVEVDVNLAWPRNPFVVPNAAGGAANAVWNEIRQQGLFTGRKSEFEEKHQNLDEFLSNLGYDGVIAGDEIVRYTNAEKAANPTLGGNGNARSKIKTTGSRGGTAEDAGQYSTNGSTAVQGFYNPKTNEITLVADGIPKGRETGVALHEIFHRASTKALTPAQEKALTDQANRWKNRNEGTNERKIYEAATARAEASGDAQGEFLTYAIEEARNLGIEPNAKKGTISAEGWLAKVKQFFTAALEKLAPTYKGELNADDLVDIAYGIAAKDAEQQAKGELPAAIDVNGKQRPTTNSKGQPIHPTLEGVRKFWEWAGDEAVLKDGKPVVLYHGTQTPEELTEFKPGGANGSRLTGDAYGVAAYFTTSPSEASFYAKEDGAVLPVYAKGEILDLDGALTKQQSERLTKFANELMLPSDKARFPAGRKTKQFTDVAEAREFFDERRKDWDQFGDNMDRAFPKAIADGDGFAVEYTDFNGDVEIKTGNDAFTLFRAVGFDNLPAAGFDGLKMSRDGGQDWLVLHNPEGNVKSATGNAGTFDPANPDIRYSRQPLTIKQMEEMAKTGKAPVENTTRQEKIQAAEDFMATRFADSTRPHDVWARTQDPELGAALVVDKNLAPGRIADFEKRMMNEHGNKIANELGRIAKKYKLSYDVAKQNVGNWMTATYAVEANAHLKAKDQKALAEAIADAEEVKAELKDYEQLQADVNAAISSGNVTRTQLDALIVQSRRISRAEVKLQKLQATSPQNAEAVTEKMIRTAYLENLIDQEDAAFKAMRETLATSGNTATARSLMRKVAVDMAKLKKELGTKSAAATKARTTMVERSKAIAGPVQDPTEKTLEAGVAGGYTDATAKYMQGVYEGTMEKADLEKLAELVYDLNAWKLDQDLKSGRVTKEMVAQWPKSRKYVPLTGDPRSEISEGADMFATGSVNQSKDKAMQGRTSSLAQNGIDASFEQVDKAAKYYGWEPYKQTLHDWYSDQMEEKTAQGMSDTEAAAQIRAESGITRARETMQRPSDNTIIYRKGKEAWVYDLGSEEAVAALKSSYKEPLPALLKLAGFGTRFLARSVTQFLPGLGPVNFVRDVWTKSENIRTRGQELGVDMNQVGRDLIKLSADTSAASAISRALAEDSPLKGALKLDKTSPMQAEFARFLELGGASTWGAYVSGDAEGLTQKLAEAVTVANAPGAWAKTKAAAGAAVKTLEVWNGTFELQTTFATFRALKQNGVEEKKAAEIALEAMNFRKSGTYMAPIRALYMFANPIALDAQQVYKTLKTPRGQKRFAAYLGIGMALYAMLRAGEEDEETGKNLMDEESDFVLERNIPVRIPGTDIKAKVPVGFGMPQLAWGTAVHLNKFLLGDRTAGETMANIAKTWVKTAAPLAPSEASITKDFSTFVAQTISPTNIKPLVNVALNKNFAGGTLNPREDTQGKPNALMGKRNTPEFYKDVAKEAATSFGIDATPEAWKEIIQGYTVGPIREVIKGTIDQPKKEEVQKILGEAGRKTSPVISPFIDRFVYASTDDELRQRMYYRVRDELADVSKKEQLGKELSPKEKQMLKLHGEVKKMEGSARSILAQASKSKSETQKARANVLYAKEMIKIEAKVLARMNTMKGLE